LWAASGDGDTYRRRCEDILTHFADLADGDQTQWILRGCLAKPPSEQAQALIQPLAERPYRSDYKFGVYVKLAKGLADLRAARYAEAIQRSQDVLDVVDMHVPRLPEANRLLRRGLAAQCCFVRAICYHQLGQPAEAQRAFDQGIAYRESGAARHPDFGWWETLIADVLRQEAEGLLETSQRD
jgi:tetratricopeptide (TPR) repeat protein